MTNFIKKVFVVCFLSLFSIASYAHHKVVVIPMAGDLIPATQLKNVITVSAENADFTDLIAAMDSITDNADNNRYLVILGPGAYDLGSNPLHMKQFVDIHGSGQNVTLIMGDISSGSWGSAALIFGADDATLSNLRVENTGTTGTLSAAIYNVGKSPTLRNVTLKVHDVGNRSPVHNTGGASPNIFDSSLLAGDQSSAIYSFNNCHPLVVNSYLNGTVYSQGNSSVQVEHSYINTASNHPTVRTDGYVTGPGTGPASANIFSSTLNGGAADTIRGGILPKCAGVADENNAFYAGPACP